MPGLIASSYYICAFLLVVFFVAAAGNWKGNARVFAGVGRGAWVLLLGIFLLALGVRAFAVPHRHYAFHDEYQHMDIAANMASGRKFALCRMYLDGTCRLLELPQWTPGYHFLLALVFSVVGAREGAAYGLNAVAGALSVVLIFLLAYLVTKRDRVAALAAFLLACYPLHLKFSGNASLEMISSLFLLAAGVALLVFFELEDKRSFFQATAAFAWLFLLRPENVIFVAPALLFWSMRGQKYRFHAGWHIFLLLWLPVFLYFPHIWDITAGSWLEGRPHASVWELLAGNAGMWFNNRATPWIFMAAAIAGGVGLFRENRKMFFWLAAWFLLFLGVYTFVHKAPLAHGNLVRLNIQMCAPLIVLAAAGLMRGYDLLCRRISNPFLARGLAVFVVAINICQCLSYVYAETVPASLSQLERVLSTGVSAGEDAVFVAYEPALPGLGVHRSSVHIALMSDPCIIAKYLKGRRLILIDDFFCGRDAGGYCSRLKKEYDLEKVAPGAPDDPGMFYVLKPKGD